MPLVLEQPKPIVWPTISVPFATAGVAVLGLLWPSSTAANDTCEVAGRCRSMFPAEQESDEEASDAEDASSALDSAMEARKGEKETKEHTTNKRPSNWDKHTKPRPGRQSEKKRQHSDWTPNPNKKK